MSSRRLIGASVALALLAPTPAMAAPKNTAFTVGIIRCAGDEAVWSGWSSGLAFASKGRKSQGLPLISGRAIKVLTRTAANATSAATAFAGLATKGARVIVSACGSADALALASLAQKRDVLLVSADDSRDAITGVNRWTFRASLQMSQWVGAALRALEIPDGSSLQVVATDGARAQAVVAAVQRLLQGSYVRVLDPVLAGDEGLANVATRVRDARPDFLLIATPEMGILPALKEQGVFRTTDVYALFDGPDATAIAGGADVGFVSRFLSGSGTPPEKAMGSATVGAAEGFTAAQIVARAVGADPRDRSAKMIAALEGWRFVGVSGSTEVRREDHALLQAVVLARIAPSSNRLSVVERVPSNS